MCVSEFIASNLSWPPQETQTAFFSMLTAASLNLYFFLIFILLTDDLPILLPIILYSIYCISQSKSVPMFPSPFSSQERHLVFKTSCFTFVKLLILMTFPSSNHQFPSCNSSPGSFPGILLCPPLWVRLPESVHGTLLA